MVKTNRNRLIAFALAALLLPALTTATPSGFPPIIDPTSTSHQVLKGEEFHRDLPKEPFKALQFVFEKMNMAMISGNPVASLEFRVERVKHLPGGELSALEPLFEAPGKLVLRLRLLRSVADNPVLVLEEMARLQALTQMEGPEFYVHEYTKVSQFLGEYVKDSNGHYVPDPKAPASHWHHFLEEVHNPIFKALGLKESNPINGRNPLAWSELNINAAHGSRLAQRELAEIEMQLATAARDSKSEFLLLKNQGDPQLMKDAVLQIAQVRGYAVNASASPAEVWSEYFEKRLDWLKRDFEEKTGAARREWAEHRAKMNSPSVRDAKAELEQAPQKLNDLVKANDRAGVARLLETYLSLETMEPFERGLWQEWIESIRNPDLANRRLLFRGIDKDDPVQKVFDQKGKETGYGFFSTLLTKNQGNYTRRLRSFATMRMKFANPINLQLASGASLPEISPLISTPKVAEIIFNHSKDPKGSPFMSFTLSPSVAYSWAESGGGYLVAQIDARRALPNVISLFKHEVEMLVPMIVFPDEVVHYEKFSETHSFSLARLEEVLERASRKLGRKIENVDLRINRAMFQDVYRIFGQAQARLLAVPDCAQAFGGN
jgi:hypothetical protein